MLASLGAFTTPGFTGAISQTVFPGLDNPFSLTIVATITHESGVNITSFNANVTATPEPGTWMLMGSGLIGIIGYGWKRKQRTA